MDYKTPTKNNEALKPQQTESKEDHKSRKKYFGHLFVFIILVVIVFEYYVYVFEIYLKKIISKISFKIQTLLIKKSRLLL